MTADAVTDRVLRDLIAIDEQVGGHIRALVEGQMGRWSESGGDESVQEVLAKYQQMALSGGKRLRPGFVRWAFEGAGGDPSDTAIGDVAVAVELLHTFALIHDDVMDQANTRRGIDTIHVTYAARHRSLGLRGDADHYGNSIAILMGDLAFAHAAHLMTKVPAACAEIFFSLCADLMVGQYLDIEASARGPVPGRDIANQITELKTARYTVEGPLLMGAAMAGRVDELRPYLTGYGRPLGHAFQLRDDLLGAFGDPERTGKPVGDDIAQGKVTRLIELGLVDADDAGRALLQRLGTPAMAAGDVERAQDLLDSCGARAEVEATIRERAAQAIATIESSPLSAEIRDVLVAAAHLIALRDH